MNLEPTSFNDVKKRITLDFDGVFNEYKGWNDYLPIPKPQKGLIPFLKELSKNYEILICTARNTDDVKEWLQKYDLCKYITHVSNTKYPSIVYVDDRGITFNGNYDETLQQIKQFKTYWED